MVGLATVFGAGGGTSSYQEIENTDVIVLWGSNARDAHPIFFHHVLKGVHNGAKLFVVDPRRTASAAVGRPVARQQRRHRRRPQQHDRPRDHPRRSGQHRLHLPRHDGVTTSTRRRSRSGRWNAAALSPACLPRPSSSSRTASPTAGTAQLCWTLGITEHHNGVDNVLALINLALLCGHVGRWGAGLNPLRGQNNVQGGGDMGAIPNRLVGFQDMAEPAIRAKFEAAWGVAIQPQARLAPHPDVRGDGARRAAVPSTRSARTRRRAKPTRSTRSTCCRASITWSCKTSSSPRPPSSPTSCCRARPRGARAKAPSPTASGACSGAARRSIRRRSPRRHRDHPRHLPPPRPRVPLRRGPTTDRRIGVERDPFAVADARRHDVPAHRRARRHPVAVPQRDRARAVVPPRPAVGRRPGRPRSTGAVQRGHRRSARRRAQRRVPAAPHHRPSARQLQHRRAVGRVPQPAALGRVDRHLAGRRVAATGSSTARPVAITSRTWLDPRAGAHRSVAAAGPGVHDLPLPRRGRHQHPHDRSERPEVGHGRVQGNGGAPRQGARRRSRRGPEDRQGSTRATDERDCGRRAAR